MIRTNWKRLALARMERLRTCDSIINQQRDELMILRLIVRGAEPKKRKAKK